jgi:hypothetical protein
MSFADTHAITDTGATLVFVMKGIPLQNVKQAVVPITINLPNGETVQSMHTCKINIPGLPVALTGHIVPGLLIAYLMGIRILCKADAQSFLLTLQFRLYITLKLFYAA